MLLAVSDAVALGIVTSVCSLFTTIIAGIVSIQLAKVNKNQALAATKVEEVAVVAAGAANKVEEVKTTLKETATETTKKLENISIQVEEVHKATNGMKHELVEEVRKASFAQGVKSEKEKGTE